MSEQPAERWTPGQAALVAFVVILAVQVLTTLVAQVGLLMRSDAAILNVGFAATCGLVGGLVGAGRRWKERWPAATAAYRVAMWCFVLVGIHLVLYDIALQREKEERIQKALEEYRQQQEQQGACGAYNFCKSCVCGRSSRLRN